MTKVNREMVEWFVRRTKNHINSVKKWVKEIVKYKPEYNGLLMLVEDHDMIKFKEPELTPYIYITWKYRMNREGKDYEIPEKYKNAANDATIHHIVNSPHHPEHWDKDFDENMFNKNDRDGVPEQIVDATKMPMIRVAEMVADWFAVAEERKTNPIDWAKMNINKRWKFNDKQVKLIYDLIENVWE